MEPQLLAVDFDRTAGVATYVYRVEVSHAEMVPTADGRGKVSQPLPPTLEEVTVRVGVRTITRSMGPVAARSKGGRCVDGHVTVIHKRPKKR